MAVFMRVFLFLSCLCPLLVFAAQNSALDKLQAMPKASLYLPSEPELSLRPEKSMIPASTLKILSALLALDTWGSEHRFHTDFYLQENEGKNVLWVKGYGDPFLTSEELDVIVQALLAKGLKRLSAIAVDSHYFAEKLKVDGRSKTDNPYDAPLNALALNFNTMMVKKNKKGISSAEPQTPATPLMQALAKNMKWGKHRINIIDQKHAAQYFAQVLREKLRQQGLDISESIIEGKAPEHSTVFYRHLNSKTLDQVLAGMLKYSNNFIANQLFMMMGAQQFGAPATMEKAQRAYSAKVKALLGWNKTFYEGAGLSRQNQLSSTELVEILKLFAPHKHLLKAQNKRILAKTGTLSGVSSYAGYLYKKETWVPFALIINQKVNYNFRKQLALELLR